MRCALLTCEVPVELVTPNRSNKLVEDSAGRLRPTAAARMNGNSLLSKLDKRYGQEAGCSGAPARRRPGGRHGRRSLGRSTALTHEALACAGRAATPPPVKNARNSGKVRYFFPRGAPPPGPPGQDPFMDVPPRRGRRGCRPPVARAYSSQSTSISTHVRHAPCALRQPSRAVLVR